MSHSYNEQFGMFYSHVYISKPRNFKMYCFDMSTETAVLYWHQPWKQSPTIPGRSPDIFVVLTVVSVLSDCTCSGNFSSSLHMVYVIFARSHLYFKSPHLVTHFFCLAHSAVRILVSTSYKAPGSLSAQEKKKTARREQVGLLYKLNTQTLQKFRLPPSLQRSAEQYSGPTPQARRRLEFLLWYGCLDEGQQERVKLPCMSGGCVGNCSHFMRNLYPH